MPRLSPLALKERASMVFLEKGNLDVLDGAFVVVDAAGVRTHIPEHPRMTIREYWCSPQARG